MHQLQITILSNAAVLIQAGGESVLIDGLYHAGPHPFSNLPASVHHAIHTGQPPFSQIGHLLFTHLHPDHFDAAQVDKFLRTHCEVQSVVLPAPRSGHCPLPAAAPLQLLHSPPGVLQPVLSNGEFHITALATQHMGPPELSTAHYCFSIICHRQKLLLLADAEPQPEQFAPLFQQAPFDAVLLNPLQYQQKSSAALLQALRPRMVGLYHIPAVEDDAWGLRKKAEQQLREHSGHPYFLTACLRPMQALTPES